MTFWLDKGVDGFRMDVIPLISKRRLARSDSGADERRLCSSVGQWIDRDEYLRQMNREVLSKYDVMTVGEAIGITLEEEPSIISSQAHELNLVFNFDAVRINRGEFYSKRSGPCRS